MVISVFEPPSDPLEGHLDNLFLRYRPHGGLLGLSLLALASGSPSRIHLRRPIHYLHGGCRTSVPPAAHSGVLLCEGKLKIVNTQSTAQNDCRLQPAHP